MEGSRKFKVEAPRVVKPVPNGAYTGKITKMEYRDSTYRGENITYADLTIDIDQLPETTVVASFPAKTITPNASFGKFIANWHPIKVGEELDPATILIGKEVSFTVINEPGKSDPKQMYPKVIRDTLLKKDAQGQQSLPAAAQTQSSQQPQDSSTQAQPQA